MIWYASDNTLNWLCRIQSPNPQGYLNALGQGFEAAYAAYPGLNYPLPGTAPYQVYVEPIQAFAPAITFLGWTYVSNVPQLNSDALAAHEFFHAIQFTYQQTCPRNAPYLPGPLPQAWYDNEDLRWWMEATAQWAQQEAVKDPSFTSGIPDHLNSPWLKMDTRPQQGGTNIPYSVLFPLYLIEKMQPGQINKNIIRQSWEAYQQNAACGPMLPVIDSVLPSNKSLTGMFPDYAEANYFLGYTVVVDNQGTVNDIRDVLRAYDPRIRMDFRPAAEPRDLEDQTQTLVGPKTDYGGRTIDPLAAGYVEFSNKFSTGQLGKGRSLRITVTIPVGNLTVQPVVKIWNIYQYPIPAVTAPVVAPMPLTRQNGNWVGVATMSNVDDSQLRWIAMEMTNPETSGSSMTDWQYTAEIMQPTSTPSATATNTTTPTPTTTPTITP